MIATVIARAVIAVTIATVTIATVTIATVTIETVTIATTRRTRRHVMRRSGRIGPRFGPLVGVVALAAAVCSWVVVPAAQAATGPTAARPAAGPVLAAPATTTPSAVTTTSNGRALSVDPVAGLPTTDATITVAGTGFNTAHGLFVAVCMNEASAPADLTHCIGGPVPDQNETSAWAHITTGGAQPSGGGVGAAWGAGGSFSVQLQLPAAVGDNVDCTAAAGCQVYTRSDVSGDSSQNMALPITFAPAPTPTPTPSSTPSPTPTIAPSTVQPVSVESQSVAPGGQQVIKFTGFLPGEGVAVTLFSDPISLPQQTADSSGAVTISFLVPQTLSTGTHTIQARGLTSGVTGLAHFQVTVPPPTTSPSPTTATTTTASTTTASTTTAPTTTAPTTTAPTTTPATLSSASTTTSAIAAAPGAGHRNLWWLWVLIAVVVVLAVVATVVAVRRRNAMARENEAKERTLADAAAAERARNDVRTSQAAADAPTMLLRPPGAGAVPGEDPNNPVLFSHRAAEERAVAEHAARTAGTTEPVGGPDAGPDAGPGTAEWRPDFTGGQGSGPQTSAWRPDFTGGQGSGPQTSAWKPDFTGGEGSGPQTSAWKPDFTGGQVTRPESGGRHSAEPGGPAGTGDPADTRDPADTGGSSPSPRTPDSGEEDDRRD